MINLDRCFDRLFLLFSVILCIFSLKCVHPALHSSPLFMLGLLHCHPLSPNHHSLPLVWLPMSLIWSLCGGWLLKSFSHALCSSLLLWFLIVFSTLWMTYILFLCPLYISIYWVNFQFYFLWMYVIRLRLKLMVFMTLQFRFLLM